MGSKGVVSIRVEALSVSITIADGNIAIEQTKTEVPAASTVPEQENSAPQAVRLCRNPLEFRYRLRLARRAWEARASSGPADPSRCRTRAASSRKATVRFRQPRKHLSLTNLMRSLIDRRHRARTALPGSQKIPIRTKKLRLARSRYGAMKRSRS
jgi:hypothetical protein